MLSPAPAPHIGTVSSIEALDASKSPAFSFREVALPEQSAFAAATGDAADCLTQWGLKDSMWCRRFTFNQPLASYQTDAFVLELLNAVPFKARLCDVIRANFKVMSASGQWTLLGQKLTHAHLAPLQASVTSMDFFDRLTPAVVRSNGALVQCMDDYSACIPLPTCLHQCLFSPASEHFELFSDTDRQEFLFSIMAILVAGGRVCQYDDEFKRYLDMSKQLYKELVSAVKNPKTGQIQIASRVFCLKRVEGSAAPLFPANNSHDYDSNVIVDATAMEQCFILIDDARRIVTVLYHAEP